MRYSKAEQAESEAWLRERLNPGDTVYCVLRHLAGSGMSRVISFLVFRNGHPLYLDRRLPPLLGIYAWNDKYAGVAVNGCGMDAGFEVVYNLSTKLFGDGYKLNHRWL